MTDQPGTWDGKHYTEYVDTVRELKRKSQIIEAVTLLGHLVDATEAEAAVNGPGWGVAPWYYEQLAIIYHKAKDFEAEIAILERYELQRHAPGQKPAALASRLAKARSERRSGTEG